MADRKRTQRIATRRMMTWPTRVLISVLIPLVCGVGVASTGLPRWAYNNAYRAWSLTGLYDPAPVQVRARSAHTARPNLTLPQRFITEGMIYTVMIVPAFVLAIFIYDRLTFRYFKDRYLRCLECGHILRGLSEPRCPECGERI